MTSVSNSVDEATKLIRARLTELDAERAKLERALANLTDGRTGRRRPGRPAAAGPRRRRRRRGGTRAEQAVKLVNANPGITASEIAARMKIQPNYLYRVLSGLEREGKVRKDGRAYHPAS